MITPGCATGVPRFVAVAKLRPAAPVAAPVRIRSLCDCGASCAKRTDSVCARCKFLDGSGHTDGLVVSMLRDVRRLTLTELVTELQMDARSAHRVLSRMVSRGRLKRVLLDVDMPREGGVSTRWEYQLCG